MTAPKSNESDRMIDGRYRISERLAEGSFGVVYRACDIRTEKQVAIKLFHSALLDDPVQRDKLLLEARVAARAGSQHIVDVLDVGSDDATGRAFLVMEFLHGMDIEHFLQERIEQGQGPLSLDEVADCLRQVATGLDRAHAYRDEEGRPAPIIHRDLKPANLFRTERDGRPLIKIVDFGIAKLSAVGSDVSLEVKGTPSYMAPEQLSGQPVSPATDVWPLGLIAFYLLTGRSYWRNGGSGGLGQLWQELLSGPLEPPTVRCAELGIPAPFPPGFDEWFSRCVHREPWSRFGSAGAAATALAALLDVGGAAGLPPTDSPRIKTVVISAAEVEGYRIGNAGAQGSSGLGAPMSDREEPVKAPGARQHARPLAVALVAGAVAVIGGVLGLRGFSTLAPPRANVSRAEPTASSATGSADMARTTASPPGSTPLPGSISAPGATFAPGSTPTPAAAPLTIEPRDAVGQTAPLSEAPSPIGEARWPARRRRPTDSTLNAAPPLLRPPASPSSQGPGGSSATPATPARPAPDTIDPPEPPKPSPPVAPHRRAWE